METAPAATAPWVPFSHPVFRALWVATIVSNIGTFMQSVGARAQRKYSLCQKFFPFIPSPPSGGHKR
jgi:hypothetical protein